MGVLEIYNRQKILSILPFPKPCVYMCGIDVEKVGIDDRRIATGVLYERMKHRAGLFSAIYGRLHWVFSAPQDNKKVLTDYAVKMGQQVS